MVFVSINKVVLLKKTPFLTFRKYSSMSRNEILNVGYCPFQNAQKLAEIPLLISNRLSHRWEA